MRAKKIILILTLFIISMGHVSADAQHISTAVMSVTVEVVDGSSVEMDQNEWITLNENSLSDTIFAIFSISNDQENSILISASQSIQMMNGSDSVVMMSTHTENRDENGQITLEFSTGGENNFTDGTYTGKQIAEIIYL